jgi:phage tail-like protein
VGNQPAVRRDPLPAFCFKVELDFVAGGGEAFFKSAGGLRYETEIIPVRAGGVNDTTFALPGATKWSPIVLRQGFTGSSELLRWREDWIAGTGRRIKTGKIIQLDTALQPRATWVFYRGWPSKWEVGELDASKTELVIETLEISHEGLKLGGFDRGGG